MEILSFSSTLPLTIVMLSTAILQCPTVWLFKRPARLRIRITNYEYYYNDVGSAIDGRPKRAKEIRMRDTTSRQII